MENKFDVSKINVLNILKEQKDMNLKGNLYHNTQIMFAYNTNHIEGNKLTEVAKSKNGKEYLKVVKEETTESRQKDMPSRLNARRNIMTKINKVKVNGENVDLPSKLFNEIAPKYADRVGGYTRIVKAEPRRGDNAPMAVLMLV